MHDRDFLLGASLIVYAAMLCEHGVAERAAVQATLEPAAFAEAFAAGRQMSLAEAVAMILMPSSPVAVVINHVM